MGEYIDINGAVYRKKGNRFVKESGSPGLTPAALLAALSGNIDNAVVAMTPGGIETQEAAGQKSFCNAEKTQLPIRIIPGTRKDFEAMGIKFGKNVDDLFVEVELPLGWKVEPTDHSMWNMLVDDTGKKRAEIFYKAAFYDRDAFMRAVK